MLKEFFGTIIVKKSIFLLLLIMGAGLVIRLSGLAEFPHGIWQDEAQNAIEARRILTEPGYRPVFVAGLSQMAALPFYFFAPFLEIFPNGVYGLRVATVLVGVGSIGTTWLLANFLFGAEAALIAAALLAVMRWHITFSQFGMAMIFTSFFIPLISYLFLKSVTENRSKFALYAGAVMGIGLQTYYSMITLPALLVLTWLYLLITRKISIGSLKQVVIFLLIGIVFYSPIIYYASNNWEAFTRRFTAASEASPRILLDAFMHPTPESTQLLNTIGESVMRHLKMFHIQGDANGRHNLPGTPMLDPGTGALFVGGLIILLFALFRWRTVFMFGWICMCLAAGVFSIGFEAPQSARSFGMTPAVAIVSALPFALLLQSTRSKPVLKGLLTIMVALSVVAIGYLNGELFFVKQRYDVGVWSAFAVEATRIGEVVRDESDESNIYVPEPLLVGSTQEFLGGSENTARMRAFNRTEDLPLRYDGKNAVIFFNAVESDTVAKILQYYPHASFEDLAHINREGKREEPIMVIARIPAADIKSLQGWEVSYQHGATMTPGGTTPSLSVDWSSIKDSPAKVYLKGLLQLRKPGTVTFTFPSEIPHRISLFDEDIGGDSILLGQGGYLFTIELSPSKQTKKYVGDITLDGTPIDGSALFLPRAFRGGLVGQYFSNKDAEGTPAFTHLDQQVSFYFHVTPLPSKPYSIQWIGSIDIPEEGQYEFGTKSKDFSSIKIDGREIVNNPESLIYKNAYVELTKGWHPISVTFSATDDYNQIYLYWRPPSAKETVVIPSEYFWPGVKR